MVHFIEIMLHVLI